MSLVAVSLWVLYASVAAVRVAEAASYTWGHVNKYAAPIYEEAVFIRGGVNATVWVAYPPAKSAVRRDYTITAMYAFDMQSEAWRGGDALILRGGVGHNHTTVVFRNRLADLPYLERESERDGGGAGKAGDDGGAHFKFVVYGLEL